MQDLMAFLIKNWMLSAGLVGLIVALLINELRHLSAIKALSPQEVVNKINHDQAKLIDCRALAAFQTGHILGAIHIPTVKWEESQSQSILAKFKSKPIIVVCHQGVESAKMGSKLHKLGFTDVVTLEGGIQAWNKEGLPLERG